MKKIIPANPGEPDVTKKKDKASFNSPEHEPSTRLSPFAKPSSAGRPFATLMMFQAGDTPLPGMNDGVLVGMIAGQFKSMLAGVDAGAFNKKDSRTETSDGTTTKMDIEVGANQDGSTVFGLGMNTESIKNGVKVTTEMQAKIEGNDCPNAEGQVQITVKVRMSARSASSGYTQEFTVFIRIQVDDNANIAAKTFDIEQSTSRSKNGQETFVQTGETVPETVVVNNKGEVLFADQRINRIIRIAAGKVATLAGGNIIDPCSQNIAGRSQEGNRDGKALFSLFNFPKGMAYDSKGNLYIADMNNHSIRKLSPDGIVTTFAK